MSKKILGLVSLMIATIVLVGCSIIGNIKGYDKDISVDEEMETVEASKNMEEKIVDNDDLAITVTQKYESGSRIYKEIGYIVQIINRKSDTDLEITISDMSVNGKKNKPLWTTTVASGSKLKDEIVWWVGDKSDKYNPNVKTLKDLKNVKGTIVVSDCKTSSNIGKYKINIK